MFDIENMAKYSSFLCYLGFLISSISGFVEISKNFNLCQLFVSIIVFFNIIGIFYLDIMEIFDDLIEININYIRAYFLMILSFLVMGLSSIGVGFGILGIIFAFANLFIGIFSGNKVVPNNTNTNNPAEQV